MSHYDEVLAQLNELLQPFVKQGKTLRPQTELVAELGLESMDVLQLLESVEDQFDISIPMNVLPEVRTVEDLARQVEALIKREEV